MLFQPFHWTEVLSHISDFSPPPSVVAPLALDHAGAPAAHIPPESRLGGPGTLARCWQGIFHRSSAEGAHRPTFVSALGLLLLTNTLSQFVPVSSETHRAPSHVGQSVEPRPDVGILKYCFVLVQRKCKTLNHLVVTWLLAGFVRRSLEGSGL